MSSRREDLAWAAGFIDGDGNINLSESGYLSVRAGNTELELLLRLQRILGRGNITGPYDRSTGPGAWSKKLLFSFQIYSGADATIAGMWFALSESRRRQTLDPLGHFDQLGDNGFGRVDELCADRAPFRVELAWAAGFFDAEGCFSSTRRVGVCASMTQTDHALLERFRSALGVGKIYGPYKTRTRDAFTRKPHYFYRAHGNELVQAILAMLWPWLGTAKRRQALDRLIWTTTCRKGHPKKPGHTGCGECTKAYWAGRRSNVVGEPAVPYFSEAA